MISYGIAWLWLQGDLPGLMTAAPVRCAGDRAADDLRHARARCERTLERLQECHGKVEQLAQELDLGPTCGWITDLMSIRGCEATTAEQARRWSREILEDIDEAEEMEEKEDEIMEPDPDARGDLRRLSICLLAYGEALDGLAEIEQWICPQREGGRR